MSGTVNPSYPNVLPGSFVYAPTPAQVAALSLVPNFGTTSRTLASLLGDQGYNLKSLGALLDGSGSDLQTINTIYQSLPNGAVVYVPNGSLWAGTIIAPNPTKQVTWFQLGTSAIGLPFAGDNDLNVSFDNGQAVFGKSSINATYPPSPPILCDYFNYCPNFVGAFSGNYNQYAGVNFNGTSGPWATGNTGSVNIFFNSNGMNPAGSYDIALNFGMTKNGQTSTWHWNGISVDTTGRLPGAFAQIGELILEANGGEAAPGNAALYSPLPGNRCGLNMSFLNYYQAGWTANTAVKAKGTTQFDLTPASTIQYTATDSGIYVWVCAGAGTTGGTSPVFPVPKLFQATLTTAGLLTVATFVSGPPLAVGDYIVCGTQLNAVKILSLGTGTGGVGTYNCTTGQSFAAGTYVYAAPNITDGTATWAFGGCTLGSGYSGALFISGNGNLGVGIGINCNIYGACVDVTQAYISAGGATWRQGANQIMDFTGNGTQAGRNLRTLGYLSGNSSLTYTCLGQNILALADGGGVHTLYNTLDDGSGNVTIAGNLTVTGTLASASGFKYGSIGAPEAVANFAHVNFQTGTVLQQSGGTGTPITLAMGEGNIWQICTKTYSGNFSKIVWLSCLPSNDVTALLGLYFYDGTKLMGIEYNAFNPSIRVEKMNSPTSDNATVVSLGFVGLLGPAMCFKITQQSGILSFYYSLTGYDFELLYSEAAGTFITPTQWGWGGVNEGSSTTPTTLIALMSEL
jgi:hypothetical protein